MTVDATIAGIWKRVEKILKVHAPEVLQSLAPGASEKELNELEKAIDVRLPGDLRKSLEIHNGQIDPQQVLGFCGTTHLMSCVDMIRDWQMLTEIGVECEQ